MRSLLRGFLLVAFAAFAFNQRSVGWLLAAVVLAALMAVLVVAWERRDADELRKRVAGINEAVADRKSRRLEGVDWAASESERDRAREIF